MGGGGGGGGGWREGVRKELGIISHQYVSSCQGIKSVIRLGNSEA